MKHPPPPPPLHRHSWQNISAGVKCDILQNIVQMGMAFFMKILNDMCIWICVLEEEEKVT